MFTKNNLLKGQKLDRINKTDSDYAENRKAAVQERQN